MNAAETLAAERKARPRRRSHTVSVEVEIELDLVDTDALIDELQCRGYDDLRDFSDNLEGIYVALAHGQEARALRLMREYVQTVTGRILP